MMRPALTLVGDGIENPWNALTLAHAAALFNASCAFLDRKGLAAGWQTVAPADAFPAIAKETLAAAYAPIIACDTTEGARDIYGFRVQPGAHPALVVGNERLGLSYAVRAAATQAVQIPMAARGITSLNVAAAAAVALYYLTHASGAMRVRHDPAAHRPDLLLMGAADHVELGSAIRSAAAFGWAHVLVEDRAGVWFGTDRVTRSEGRAAARRGKNAVHLIPVQPDRRYTHAEACIITTRSGGVPLSRANLARGAQQVIVLPDERALALESEDWYRLARTITFVHLDVPAPTIPYHYRLPASIALAEVARQVGRRVDLPAGSRRRRSPHYDRLLDLAFLDEGIDVTFADLLAY